MAGPTGFEPAISSVTGRHVRPLHHEPLLWDGNFAKPSLFKIQMSGMLTASVFLCNRTETGVCYQIISVYAMRFIC